MRTGPKEGTPQKRHSKREPASPLNRAKALDSTGARFNHGQMATCDHALKDAKGTGASVESRHVFFDFVALEYRCLQTERVK